jgi:outer membrane protein OmpA-like peptidoglycan-associated protein
MNKEKIIRDLSDDLWIKRNQNDTLIEKKDEGIKITLNNLNFKPDSVELLDTDQNRIEEIAAILKTIPDRTILITGHTADVDTKEAQMKLSLERAESIMNILIEKGVKPDRLLFTGKGSTEPVAPNDTEENRKRNRRVEILILED